jgi:asparagine synthase (glutamine-hydrolysing)
MCGIYGLVARDGAEPRADVLARMAAALVHRGPDGDGRATQGPASLGCRRLAIIDVAGGTQPLTNERGDILAVCNGEIYNHLTLRRDLEARGHRFRTHSDAEVLPHLYEEHGVDFVCSLDGMFGLALWDSRRGRLVLARDRMGEKPLYYTSSGGGLAFASEPKALLAAGVTDHAPDWRALASYLRTGYVPGPASAFTGISRLLPGARLVLEGESAHVDRYWEATPLLAAPALDLDLVAAAQALRDHLTRAVNAALMSDVPLGVFLSGGLDSTAVTAVARAAGGTLNTFALRFPVPGFDEGDYAALAARELGTRHATLVITPELFLEGVRDFLPFLDEPLADAALIPTFLLSRFARRDVKVVLVGEGSDELFAGYPTYFGGLLAEHYRKVPAPLRHALAHLAPMLGAPAGNTTLRFMLRRFLEVAEAPLGARHRAWTGCVPAEQLVALAARGGPLEARPEPPAPPGRTTLDALLALDLTGYLPDDLLLKLDRATMAASLEGRAPFLDHHLVEFACRLSASHKLSGFQTKRVLRRAVADLIPSAIGRRVKRGLTVPLASWLAGPLLPFARATLERVDPRVFNPAAVGALLDDHTARRRDNRRELWALIMLQLWCDRYASA